MFARELDLALWAAVLASNRCSHHIRTLRSESMSKTHFFAGKLPSGLAFGICVTVMAQTSIDMTAPILHMPGPHPSDLAVYKTALLPMLCAHACS